MNFYRPILQKLAADGPFEFWGLVDDDGVLTLRVRGMSADVVFVFDAYSSYRKYEESDAMRTLGAISESAAAGRSFYTVDQSDFDGWLVAESAGVRSQSDLTHYAIVCSNDIVDVLSPTPPDVRVEFI